MVNVEAIDKWIEGIKNADRLQFTDIENCILAIGVKSVIPLLCRKQYTYCKPNQDELAKRIGISYARLLELEDDFSHLDDGIMNTPLSVLKEYTIELLEELKKEKKNV